MMHLFTPVGISLFTNMVRWAREVKYELLTEVETAWKACRLNQAKQQEEEILVDCLNYWLKTLDENFDGKVQKGEPVLESSASAEIQSIQQIILDSKWRGTTFRLHLIATDSQASILAANILAKRFNQYKDINHVIVQQIENLQVNKSDQFIDDGIQSLVNYIFNAKRKPIRINNKNVKLSGLLNITSGYKGITPILTIVGQLLKLPLVYLYEQSNNLIEIPPLPLSFNWMQLELFEYCFARLSASPGEERIGEHKHYTLELLRDEQMRNFLRREMIQNALVKEVVPQKEYQITFLGRLLKQHINEVYPAGTKVFGLAIEFLFYEALVEESLSWNQLVFSKVIHHRMVGKRDIDLELQIPSNEKQSEVVYGEICSFGQLADFNGDRKYYFLKQLRNQLKLFRSSDYRPWAYVLFIYGFVGMSSWNELSETLIDIEKKLQAVSVPRFRAFGVSLPLETKSTNNSNPYSSLYQRKITFDKQKWRLGNKDLYGNPYLWLEELTDWKK